MSAYRHSEILVLSQDLQDFAWSAPMRDLAAKIDLSDVGLKKLLKAQGIVTPPQGYWNKLHAGKPVPRCPKVPARGPGQTGRTHLDSRFANVLNPVEPIPSSGPFASALVPEDLDQLYQRELKGLGRIGVPKTLDRVHYGLAKIFKKEQQRREKSATQRWNWDEPKFDSPVDKRRLRLFNAVFMALSKRGHGADAYERDGEIDATAIIGATRVSVDIAVAGTHRKVRIYGRDRPAPDLPPSTPLKFLIDAGHDRPGDTRWQDDSDGKLEAKIPQITAAIITAGERAFRRHLKEAEEREEQFRRWREKQRLEQIEARNRERLKHLRESGELLRQAEDLRALIASVREAAIAGSVAVDSARLEAWERWASDQADRLDPVLSGQIMTHLAPKDEV